MIAKVIAHGPNREAALRAMKPTLNGQPLPMWESVAVNAGDVLAVSFATVGARTYIATGGGIDTPAWLQSRSTFHKAGVGGIDGHALKAGQIVPPGHGNGREGRRVKPDAGPVFATDKKWNAEVVLGPNDDWIDEDGHRRFLATDWKLSSKSARTGFRLEGPESTFAAKARDKAPEHGLAPSNIIDQGYPVGAINLAGLTPIVW